MYRFLIADDETQTRNSIRTFAEEAGFVVEEAKNGIEAVAMCREDHFDIIVMNVALPELDGIAACKEIRKFDKTPVVFISSFGTERDKLLGFDAGADDYMIKPFSMKVMMARIHAIIKSNSKVC